MKKSIIAIAITAATPVFMPMAFAENKKENKNEELPMEEMIITSSALNRKKAETALPVTVISGEELHNKASNTLGETLSATPGIASASFGPSVGQPVIRGQQGNRVRILQNSTGNIDASSSGPDHAVTIEPLLAESIEVLKGPSTLLYGGGAIGGVINVIDNRIPKTGADGVSGAFEQRFDSASEGKTSILKLDGGSDDWAWHVDGLYRGWEDVKVPVDPIAGDHDDHGDSHNTIHNSGGTTKNITAGFSRIFDEGYLGFSVSHLDNKYGIPEGGHDHGGHAEAEEHEEEEVWIDLKQNRYDIAGGYELGLAWAENIQLNLTYTDYEHLEYEGQEVATTYTSNSWENRLEASHSFAEDWTGVIGMQNQRREFQALAGHHDHEHEGEHAAFEGEDHGAEALIPETKHSSDGLFWVESYQTGNWIHEFGGRVDVDQYTTDGHVAEDRDFTSLSFSASSIWQFHDNWSTSMALSRSERAPSIDELYSNVEGHDIIHGATGTIQLGNQDLNTEVSNNIDLSLRWSFDRIKGDITLFHNDFSDYIYLLKTDHNADHIDVYTYNQQDATFKGVEVTSNILLSNPSSWAEWDLDVFADAIEGKNADGSYVPRLPPYRLGATLNFHKNNWGSYLRTTYAAAQDNPGLNEDPTDSYTRVDVAVNYSIASAHTDTLLFMRVKNLTNAEIRNATSFLRDVAPEAGRSLELGARVMF